jgi:arylsulfate sulfotransferase
LKLEEQLQMKNVFLTGVLIAAGCFGFNHFVPAAQSAATCGSSFIKVTANAKNKAKGYPDPKLSVTCSSGTITIDSNNIPNFEFVQTTPNPLQAQNLHLELALKPALASSVTAAPLGGPIAVTVNGLYIFGPTEAPQDGFKDPFLNGILDYCNGHTAPRGDYHFHARPDCIADTKKVGTVLGFALDGFPILSPYVCADTTCKTSKKLVSSWRVKAGQDARAGNAWKAHEFVAGAGDLDKCNGRKTATGYAYYATDSFPYFVGCFVGTPNLPRLPRP